MNNANRIIKIEISPNPSLPGHHLVHVTKEFTPENGGGRSTFTEVAGSLHHALEVARGMVTLSPAYNPEAAVGLNG